MRWSHDQFGPTAPVEFIPVAESAGLIDPLTWWVLDEALAQLKCWRQLLPGLLVAINLSARSLAGTKVPERIKRSLRRTGMEDAVRYRRPAESAVARNIPTTGNLRRVATENPACWPTLCAWLPRKTEPWGQGSIVGCGVGEVLIGRRSTSLGRTEDVWVSFSVGGPVPKGLLV